MKAAEIVVVAEMQATAGNADALRAVLMAAVAPSNAEAGCIQYRLHEDRESPGKFLFYEIWQDKAALDFHCETPHFKALVAQSAALAGPLEIKMLRALSD
jgi:quinol monooxygenase YgiN